MFWAHWLRSLRIDVLGREVGAYALRYHGIASPGRFATYYLLPETLRDRLAAQYYRSASVLAPPLRHRFAPSHVDSIHPFPDRLRNELVRWQTVTQLPEILRYADRNSMAFSREVRLPYLDHRLVDFAFGLPPSLMHAKATTKLILRQAMSRIVPAEILERRVKVTFAPPQQQWLQGPMQGWLEGKLRAAESRRDVFNAAEVIRLREHPGGANQALAWRVASTEGWYQVMIDGKARPASAAPAEISSLSW
jgi:asparagine synthase (glutamine-hydrolysing)